MIMDESEGDMYDQGCWGVQNMRLFFCVILKCTQVCPPHVVKYLHAGCGRRGEGKGRDERDEAGGGNIFDQSGRAGGESGLHASLKRSI